MRRGRFEVRYRPPAVQREVIPRQTGLIGVQRLDKFQLLRARHLCQLLGRDRLHVGKADHAPDFFVSAGSNSTIFALSWSLDIFAKDPGSPTSSL